MNELEAVNLVLRHAGRAPVNHADSADQTAQIAKECLTRARRKILLQPFPFNQQKISLQANADERVAVPASYLKVQFRIKDLGTKFDDAHGYVAVFQYSKNDWVKTETAAVITFDITNYEHIPDAFVYWIAFEAASDFYHEVNQVESRYLMSQAAKHRAVAINETLQGTIHSSTGWDARQSDYVRA